ncbi:small GTP-binding protein [Tritrichomonas foetus]|uniref:Small GTP-binding protein n=1 Tax=Tritrichomonas foetus TaxID=1144522 RepID=A0A1J4JTJ4_9EUKA|nr:small GTP-binding protein [Tritrichomonas foetus]|eukprot:OHT02439.1 small GTP-binding protein [Tritrichomonas foetus]
MSESEIPSYKIIILGDTGVGKTSLAIRQCRGQFTFQMTPTIGTSHMKAIVSLGDKKVELKIWDTAGQEQFASLVSMYARGAQACIMVASFVDPGSLSNLETWHERLHATGENPPIIVAINKIDMHEGAPMSIEQIRETYGQKFPNMFFVSARTGDGVTELFTSAADEAVRANESASKGSSKSVNLDDRSNNGGGCC